jgi:hypothetical protein
MHIQDAFHPDGISYDSPDDFSDTDSDPKSSDEKFDKNDSVTKDESGKNCKPLVFLYALFLVDKTRRSNTKSKLPPISPPINIVVVSKCFQ